MYLFPKRPRNFGSLLTVATHLYYLIVAYINNHIYLILYISHIGIYDMWHMMYIISLFYINITSAQEWGNRTLVDHERFDV